MGIRTRERKGSHPGEAERMLDLPKAGTNTILRLFDSRRFALGVVRGLAGVGVPGLALDAVRSGSRRRRRGGLGPGDRLLLRRWRAHVRGSCLQRLVSNAGDEEPGCEHRRHLGADAESADSNAAARSTAEERRERSGKRDRAQMIQRGPLGALTALEGRAVLAFAEVRPQRSPISATANAKPSPLWGRRLRTNAFGQAASRRRRSRP